MYQLVFCKDEDETVITRQNYNIIPRVGDTVVIPAREINLRRDIMFETGTVKRITIDYLKDVVVVFIK